VCMVCIHTRVATRDYDAASVGRARLGGVGVDTIHTKRLARIVHGVLV
jgi:hypothetical protein